MKKGLKRSLVRPPKATDATEVPVVEHQNDAPPSNFKRAVGGAGSAWKAGAVAQAQGDLEVAREKLAQDILAGVHVIDVEPEMLIDPIGSDRRDDWKDLNDFESFVTSIKDNGQDMPVLVWPKDPDWQPDEINPEKIEHVEFLLLAGRRRREAARQLGRKVRAVIVKQEGRTGAEATFNMLVLRFRENDERQDLSAFERLLSIGQMYEELRNVSKTKIKAKDFAERIGVHESIVSRARAVFRAKSDFLNAFKNVHEMSFPELQSALASLSSLPKTGTKTSVKPKKILVTRKIGTRKLSVSSLGGKLSVSATGLTLDKEGLEGLSDVIATYLKQQEPNG